MPEHIHTILKLLEGDSDYSIRWKEIKCLFTREYLREISSKGFRNESRQIQGEAAIFQRRFWEHTIFHQDDLNAYIDYIHINPIKHSLVHRLSDYLFLSFQKYVNKGVYALD